MTKPRQAPTGGVAPVSKRVMNLSHFLRQSARRYRDEIGFVWGDATWTWAELDRRVDAMAAALAAQGVKKGDRILVQSKNCNQMFESMFACFRLGAVWVPTNFRQTPGEVAYLGQASGATAMICHCDFPEHVAAAREAAPDIRLVDFDRTFGVRRGLRCPGRQQYDGVGVPTAAVEHDDPCWFFFTSGTTGRPKAAVLTHGQMAFVITNHLCDLMPGTTHRDASLVLAPLSHGAGIHQLVQVARGVKTVLLTGDRFDADEAWGLVAHWRITNMFTVPTIVKMLTEHPSVDAHDHSSLRYVIYAGAPDVPGGPEARAEEARKGARPVFWAGRGHRQHHRASARAPRNRGRSRGEGRHVRIRAHRDAGLDPGRRRPRAARW